MTVSPEKIAEMLPCPFCGAAAKQIFTEIPLSKWRYRIACSSTTCGADGSSEDSMESAIEAWNRRSQLSGMTARRSSDEQAEPVGWQPGERELAHRWATRLYTTLSTKPDHADDCLWLERLSRLFASPVAMGGVTEAMVEAALSAVMPNGSTFIDWIAIPNKADLEEFGLDSKNYVLDIVRAQQQRTHAELVVRLALTAALAIRDEGMGE